MRNVFYSKARKIDSVISLKRPNFFSKIRILLLIAFDKSCENYFFERVQSVSCFNFLKMCGYFLPGRMPTPIESKEGKGYFTIPSWNVLPYLEKISTYAKDKGDARYGEELMGIISAVTEYHVKNNKVLDNYRTWGCFVRILINLPNDIVVSYLHERQISVGNDWLKVWLESKFDNIVPASDISTKLLPKYLTDKADDVKVAEQIIDVITNIKDDFFEGEDVKKIGMFEKRKDPKTTVDAYWLLESFKKNAQRIGESCSVGIILSLANKLKVILCKEREDHQVLIELGSHTYRIEVKRTNGFSFLLNVEKLHQEEIDALSPEDRYFGMLKIKGEVLRQFSLADIKDVESFVSSARTQILSHAKTAFLHQCPDLNKKLSNLYNGLYADYSSIWMKSIASEPERGMSDAKEILTVLIRDVLLAKCKFESSKGKAIVEEFLSPDYQFPLFRRLALFAIGNCWSEEYKKLFWVFLDKNPDAFEDSNYEVELFKLLQANERELDKVVEKPRLKALISAGPKDLRYKEDDEDKKKKFIAHWKQKWYLALSADSDFNDLLEAQKKITGVEEVRPPSESAFIETHWGEGRSPLDKDAILGLRIPDLVGKLAEFKSKGVWEGPTEEGLAEALKSAVKEDPNKYVNDLAAFQTVNYRYVYSILNGIADAWKEKKTFDWGKVFDFSLLYLNKPDFLESGKKAQGEDWHPYHIWILSVLADLIQEGSRDDAWSFAEEYFVKADEILSAIVLILKKQPHKEEKTHSNYVTEALNTTYGRAIIALILLGLRKARVQDKKEATPTTRWNPAQYENLLRDNVIEAYTLLGQYMPNLLYLNRSWAEEKIVSFEALNAEEIRWKAFMEGYLFGHRLYQDLYKLMRKHYIKGIDSCFKGDRAENRLVQHITIGYLRGTESLDGTDSLLKKILDKWDAKQYKEIVSFFWSESRRIVEGAEKKEIEQEAADIKDRILKFWAWTYDQKEIVQNKLKGEYSSFLSDLARLTILLDKINAEYAKWLVHIAPYVGPDFDSTFFIEYLNKFSDEESCGYFGSIFLEMLKVSTPTYHEEHIVAIVEKIYRSGDKVAADKICNIYGSRGFEFLRKIYEQWNGKNKVKA